MANIYRLDNTVQNYDWGSPDLIPSLLGKANTDRQPRAELWMGAHPKAPSTAFGGTGNLSLTDLINANPAQLLGNRCAARFEGRLPYLFKVLAAAKPLSIQAHPNLDQARAGWNRENRAGIPIDSPNRNYKDANHKPEIICALAPFTAMCGFRPRAEILRSFDRLGYSGLSSVVKPLESNDEEYALREFFSGLFAVPEAERVALSRFIVQRAAVLRETDEGNATAWRLAALFAQAAPSDPAILAPLYLNVLTLTPGEAIFLPAGILHAYVEGFGVELMANSDNVLRGGLTTKHVDAHELLNVLRFEPFSPRVIAPIPIDGNTLRSYPTPAPEFALDTYEGLAENAHANLAEGTPIIVLVIEGTLTYHDDSGQSLSLSKGQSAFISAAAPKPRLRGKGNAYLARVPADERGGPS